MFRKRSVLAVLSVFALSWQPVSAHHAFSAFDADQEITVTGTVKEWSWRNPHVWLWVMVPDESSGADVEWGFEATSIRHMADRGWTRSSLKPGDAVTVVLHPRRDGMPGGAFVSLKLLNGSGSVPGARGE